MAEQIFLTTYGSPLLQALVGLGTDQAQAGRAASSTTCCARPTKRVSVPSWSRFEAGGLPEAMIRALIYIRLPERSDR